jgi:pSer/pThr/pTyr-binding forkhead associated (FHA) protein
MSEPPRNVQLTTPAELKERIEAERRGRPFLVYREGDGTQRIHPLPDEDGPVMVGRDDHADIALDWDPHVSGLHAELRRTSGSWLVIDDGLSRNGTFVNGERVVGRRRLRDVDEIKVGKTALVFRSPTLHRPRSTAAITSDKARPELSPAQRRVLVALCRPYGARDAFARPATNRQIGDELHLTVAAVKTHLRTLFQRFTVDDLPNNEKRAELVRLAFETGAVSSADIGRES